MTDKCRCTFAQQMVGDGCRYCQPQEHIDRLLGALAEEEADANRYRWLRAHCPSASYRNERWSIIIEGTPPGTDNSEDDFDAAIDAAMTNEADDAAL